MSTTWKGLRIEDPEGEAFQAKLDAAWQRYGSDLRAYRRHAPSLPAWHAAPCVTRELMGTYLLDRDSGTLHDVRHAIPECGIDGIANATWMHFAAELDRSIRADTDRLREGGRTLPPVTPCPHCLLPHARAVGGVN